MSKFAERFALATELAPTLNRAQRRDLARTHKPAAPPNGRSNRSDAPRIRRSGRSTTATLHRAIRSTYR